MAERFSDVAAKLGDKPMLATFLESTRKIIAVPGNWRRYGVYWWALKAVLKMNGLDLGGQDCTWLREEYTVKSPKGVIDQESTILAAWIFAEENTFSPEVEFEIDDQVWLIDDTDMT
ncbi:MAG: hypothetical protein COW02_03505 [Comamonadaceae bacterium CG12_big_fil_rev_8_21_14_0_65_59_15]|nr:MAG: hypothetical protein COW02_03505 [Comamonadaceae bacterium CG12_big_fil_rev_8_21_14_0_65_59_15]